MHRLRPSVGWFARQMFFADHLLQKAENRSYTSNDFLPLLPLCDGIISEWRTITENYLSELVRSSCLVGDLDLQKSGPVLQLATTFFGCAICDEIIQYTEVLVHRCFNYHPPVSGPNFLSSVFS